MLYVCRCVCMDACHACIYIACTFTLVDILSFYFNHDTCFANWNWQQSPTFQNSVQQKATTRAPSGTREILKIWNSVWHGFSDIFHNPQNSRFSWFSLSHVLHIDARLGKHHPTEWHELPLVVSDTSSRTKDEFWQVQFLSQAMMASHNLPTPRPLTTQK